MSTTNPLTALLLLGVLYLLGVSWPLIVAAAVLSTALIAVHERSRRSGRA